ncbi:hypothetical protein, partial [Ramlibacter sp.]|uniref:hypothetical protein n=1 Tax=Ramlibacter sp. TaxID=1917967 RepID=UPI0025F7BCDA
MQQKRADRARIYLTIGHVLINVQAQQKQAKRIVFSADATWTRVVEDLEKASELLRSLHPFEIPDAPLVSIILLSDVAVRKAVLGTPDLPPYSHTNLNSRRSVNQENDGHEEEQVYRRADHWFHQAGGG